MFLFLNFIAGAGVIYCAVKVVFVDLVVVNVLLLLLLLLSMFSEFFLLRLLFL